MRRVAITGLGIVSSIGNNQEEVLESLREGRSGIEFCEEYAERGLRSHVHGSVNIDIDSLIDRKLRRFMGDGAAYNYIAMQQAIDDAGLTDAEVSNERAGIVMGSGGPSTSNLLLAWDTARNKSAKRIGPYMVPRTMSSTNSATLATPFGIKGVNYSISSACSTSAHCIGNAAELIQWGKQDIVFAGGGEELHWTMTVLFDAMPALSSGYNDTPQRASRPFDANRDGFVIAGGGGVLVLEELEHAKARGAKIYAEIAGYGATSDGFDMVQPSGEGAVRCMKQALDGLNAPIGYINVHGTSTPVGDIRELEAIREVFGEHIPTISSTKSLTGHSLGATGVHESIYSLLMMKHGFIAASANIEDLDPGAEGFPIARERIDDVSLDCVISNSFGFGGTNATLVFSRHNAGAKAPHGPPKTRRKPKQRSPPPRCPDQPWRESGA
jgi:3-oxoacyl-[acyl-carrier-protein] synthase-1